MHDLLAFFEAHQFIAGVLTGGGLITVWKWVAGWNRINLSLAVENRRTPGTSPNADELISVVRLKKGDRATLCLESVRFLVTTDDKEVASGTVNELNPSELRRTLNITPGEETHFAFHCRVPASAVCKVATTVTGRSLRIACAPLAVWKATEFSVPMSPKP